MNAGSIMALCIITIVALIMIGIGVFQYYTKSYPVGFYNMTEPPKKEEITDWISWNHSHGIIWIVYGMVIELGYWLGYFAPNTILQLVYLMGSVVFPLPLMMARHHQLVKKYQRK